MTGTADIGRIVVATDGSEASREAVQTGARLAGEHNAPVTILYIRDASDGDNGEAPTDHAALRDALDIARHEEVEPELEVIVGDPAEGIIQRAEELDADIVLVGSRGLSRDAAAVLGSVSREVLKRCRQPVMIVRGRRP